MFISIFLQTKTKCFNINVNYTDYMHKSVVKLIIVYVVTYDIILHGIHSYIENFISWHSLRS